MNFGSTCSGIEAASVAWNPLGWNAQFVSEIEPAPCKILAHRHPTVPNLGDMTKFQEWDKYDIDVLVAGTPCQSFSVAGLRAGLADPRGNLMLTYLAIANKYRSKWLVWENVPGVLSSNGGKDFGTFLGGLAELGYGFAYRVLDAQYFGVPQQRRRVILVGCLGDWRSAAAVLFERQSLQGDTPPSRKTRQETARVVAFGIDEECNARFDQFGTLLRGGQGGTRQVVATWPKEVAPTLTASFGSKLGLENQHIDGGAGLFVPAIAPTLVSNGDAHSGFRDERGLVVDRTHVRRLTPVECERLQGFPDNYTKIPGHSAVGPRYKALGNSMAVPVMRWIGERIETANAVDKTPELVAC